MAKKPIAITVSRLKALLDPITVLYFQEAGRQCHIQVLDFIGVFLAYEKRPSRRLSAFSTS